MQVQEQPSINQQHQGQRAAQHVLNRPRIYEGYVWRIRHADRQERMLPNVGNRAIQIGSRSITCFKSVAFTREKLQYVVELFLERNKVKGGRNKQRLPSERISQFHEGEHREGKRRCGPHGQAHSDVENSQQEKESLAVFLIGAEIK